MTTTTTSLKLVSTALSVFLVLLAYNARGGNAYFDVNGTAAGYGVVNGGSYSWDDPNWASSSGGGAATHTWIAGDFARLYAGAAGYSYTITANQPESMAGLYVNVSGGVNVTINSADAGALDVVTGDQGFLVNSGSTLTINAPITGAGGVAPQLTGGTLYLYGNNTYSGGTVLGYSGYPLTYFNSSQSFGTGPIVTRATGYFGLLATGGSAITLANNFQNIATAAGAGLNFASAANTPVVSTGNWDLGANNFNLRNNGDATAPLTLSGQISGTAGLALSANNNGTIIFSGANAYTGPTTVGAGNTPVTLKLAAPNTIASSSSLVMAGGILNLGGFNHDMSGTTLGLATTGTFTTSILDFTTGPSTLLLADSSGVAWTAGDILDLVFTGSNWNMSSDYLRIGVDGMGLTGDQLAQISFNGLDLGSAGITADGYIYDMAMVPEPSTALLGLLGGLGIGLIARRRNA